MGNDELVFVQKHVRHSHAFVQQPSRIVPQVQDHSLQVGIFEIAQRVGQFVVRRFIELGHANVADPRSDYQRIVHAVPRDFVARHRELQRLRIAFPADADVNRRALRSLQHVRHFRSGQPIARFPVHLQDHVAGADSRAVGRRAHKRRHYNGVVVPRGHLHPYAEVFPPLVLFLRGVRPGIEEHRMRVQFAQHPWDGPVVNRFIRVDGLGVALLHYRDYAGKGSDGFLEVSRVARRGPDGGSIQSAQQRGP